jgi:hypothetical protein
MKEFLASAVILILISLQAQGQASKDTIFLKNGSLVYGKVYDTLVFYKIRTPGGSLLAFPKEEIDRFVPAVSRQVTPVNRKTHGLGFIIESGIPISSAEKGFPLHFCINPMIDYTFNSYNSLSAGSGLEVWEDPMLPVFAEYRVNTSPNNTTMFFHLRAGWLINLRSDENLTDYEINYRNGWTMAAGVGFLWTIRNFESFIKLGYRYAYSRTTEHSDSYTYFPTFDTKYNFNCFEMKWGFRF